MDARTKRQINRELFDLTRTNPTLGTGIGQTIEIIQKHLGEDVADVVSGIYCGEIGESREIFPGYNSALVLQWGHRRLEVAYVS
ncbi:MAG: hypothetical protein ABSH28_00465 [Acidobacteriota bacterium]|jgi:hypothetical protein